MRKFDSAAGEVPPKEYVQRSRQVFLAAKIAKASIRGAGGNVSAAARESGVSPGTIKNLADLTTAWPRFSTMMKVVASADCTLEICREGKVIRKW